MLGLASLPQGLTFLQSWEGKLISKHILQNNVSVAFCQLTHRRNWCSKKMIYNIVNPPLNSFRNGFQFNPTEMLRNELERAFQIRHPAHVSDLQQFWKVLTTKLVWSRDTEGYCCRFDQLFTLVLWILNGRLKRIYEKLRVYFISLRTICLVISVMFDGNLIMRPVKLSPLLQLYRVSSFKGCQPICSCSMTFYVCILNTYSKGKKYRFSCNPWPCSCDSTSDAPLITAHPGCAHAARARRAAHFASMKSLKWICK